MLMRLLETYLFIAQACATPFFSAKNSILDRSAIAPLHISTIPESHIPDSYIVVLEPDANLALHTNAVQALISGDNSLDGLLTHVYDDINKGYAGRFSEATLTRIRNMAGVNYVEHDQKVYTADVDKSAPWGLARISHRPKLTFGTFKEYIYDGLAGEGVDAYIIDTGISVDHVEFQGRAAWGKTIPLNDQDVDANGHGTHCAGTIASRKYGVAKKANVIAVKVLGSDGSGTMSDVLAGLQWAANRAQSKLSAARAEFLATGRTAYKGAVANMSLGGGKSRALEDFVNAAVDAGMHIAVAAGNDNKNACNFSPAGAANAITVGASTLGDQRAYFSNVGPCVDVFAPGLNILSTYIPETDAVARLSGTSMASPHVAGLVAYLLSIYPSATFDPDIEKGNAPAASEVRYGAGASLYMAVQTSLPIWISSFLPKPQTVLTRSVAPIPATINPAQLKAAIIRLSTRGLLSDVPANTVNMLVFNNATSLKEEQWTSI